MYDVTHPYESGLGSYLQIIKFSMDRALAG